MIISIAFMLALGAVIVVLDWKQVRQLAGNADWGFLVVALGFVALAYLCFSASIVVMWRIFGVGVDRLYLLRVGFVSAVLSNLIALPAGLWLMLLVLGRQRVSNSQIVGSSLLLSYFKNLVYYSLIPVSLVYVIFTYPLVFGGVVTSVLVIIILIVVLTVATVIVFNSRIRAFILGFIGKIWRSVIHRNIEASLDKFGRAVTEGITALRQRRHLRLLLAGLVLGDVAATITALWFCFKALGVPVHVGVLITGFNFGITLTVISFIPGDLGVQEASVAGILALFGVPFSQGVLGAILFRVLFYLVPFVISLGFYWGLVKGTKRN
jgi:uncharacterized protein (TIRG00374 family)